MASGCKEPGLLPGQGPACNRCRGVRNSAVRVVRTLSSVDRCPPSEPCAAASWRQLTTIYRFGTIDSEAQATHVPMQVDLPREAELRSPDQVAW